MTTEIESGTQENRNGTTPLTEFQSTEKLHRLQLLSQFTELRKKMSGNRAARILGESHAVLSRWQRRLEEGGENALVPEQATGSGRKPKFDLDADEKNALRFHRLQKDSLPLAIEDFIQDPKCRPQTREKILAELDLAARERRDPNWPLSLQRAGHVTVDEEGKFRGDKHAQAFEIVECRGLFYLDENKNSVPITGNTIFESDDMSSNEPFRYADPEAGAIKVGRQMLASIDVFAAKFLGVSPVGRDRDAYRLEDIADHMLNVVLAFGLPLIWRLERGSWESSVVDGIDLKNGVKGWGSLGALFKVHHVFKSRSKGLIETSFDFLQSLTAHQSLSIGRHRGEFERAAKLFLAAGRGDQTAALEFWEISAAADAIAAAMVRFNHRPKTRRAFGRAPVVPEDLYRTAEKRACPASELWRFFPYKKEATVRGGCIEKSVDHYPFPFRFHVNGVDGCYLEQGYSVLVAFHPGRPEEGCHVFNAEHGARNRDGYKFGELICVAPLAPDAPQLNLSPDEYTFLARKNSNAALRSEFRAIVGAGVRGRRSSTAQDGYGNSARVEASAARTNFPSSGGYSARANPEDDVVSPRSDRGGRFASHTSPRAKGKPFDEKAELEKVARLESEAIARGDLVT